MEKAAVAGRNAGHPRKQVLQAWCCAALFVAAPVGAQQAPEPPAGATLLAQAHTGEPPVRLEVQTSALPRLQAHDSGFQAPRVDLSLFPGRGHGLGAVLGMSGFGPQPQHPLGLAPMRPSVDVGLRWSHRQLDITAWRRMSGPDDAYSLIQMRQPVYGARVEMNLKPARIRLLGLERGFLGFQLESGARISIKRKDGRPMIYYRTTF